MITAKDKRHIDKFIGEVILTEIGEEFGLYDNCETDEQIEQADRKSDELLAYLVSSLQSYLGRN